MYWDDIKNGKRQLVQFHTARRVILDMMNRYNTKIAVAHNASFDYRALKNTQRYITKSKYRFFFPYGIEIQDTLKMARQTIGQMPTYIKWCFENGYVTKHKTPRPQVKAEVLYKYITGNNDFVESHTGLEDVLIEKEILAYCFRKHKKMTKELYA
jgi:DNA polymerase III epsilon subunit-like protein